MKQLKEAFKYRQASLPPWTTREFMKRFDHVPHDSVTALLRKAGPFVASRDGYRFRNGDNDGWPITEEDARVLREHYQGLVDPVSILGIGALRTALTTLSISVPLVGTVGLPIAAIDFVIDKVTGELRNKLLDSIVSTIPGRYGRCGGMAFSGYDFFLVGWPVDGFDVQPASGDLRQYIWRRLLDSLEQNALTFFEWIMVLHILPVISKLASGALGTWAGSAIGGPLGIGPLAAAVGTFVAGKEDVLGLGGTDSLLEKTREHWGRLGGHLYQEAAWPVGFIYGGNASPIDQHQVLAIGYTDRGDGTGRLTIWDNNDGAMFQNLDLDFRGDQLFVNSSNPDLNDIKGIICEEYTSKMPPASLRR